MIKYIESEAKKNERKAQRVIKELYEYFLENPETMPDEYDHEQLNCSNHEAVKDYIAGMSDRYAVNRYKHLFLPRFWV